LADGGEVVWRTGAHDLLHQDLEGGMASLARDVMTPEPTRCTINVTLDQGAKLMVEND
jgi:hypothetical protein